MVEHHLLTDLQGASKLEALKNMNQRLPMSEIDRLIEKWRGRSKKGGHYNARNDIINEKAPYIWAMERGGKRSLILGSETSNNPIGQTELLVQR